MKRLSYCLILLLACGAASLGCGSKGEAPEATSAQPVRQGFDPSKARIAAREHAARAARDHLRANDPTVRGFVSVQDDSLTNTHSFTASLFTGDGGGPSQCFETFPLEGGG